MAFRITQSRPRKVQKCIAAFEVAEDEDDVPGSSSSKAAEALAVSANQWVEKGTAYAEEGDHDAALRCWDQAALINPANGQLHEMRAQVLNDLGHTFEAVQAAQQAVRYRPDWPEAHITLARVQLNLGEPQLALASYQSAAKLQPGHPDLLEELPRAQMLAKMHKQQPTGTRAYVVDQENDTRVQMQQMQQVQQQRQQLYKRVKLHTPQMLQEVEQQKLESQMVQQSSTTTLQG